MTQYIDKVAFTMDLKTKADAYRLRAMFGFLPSLEENGWEQGGLPDSLRLSFNSRAREVNDFIQLLLEYCPTANMGLSTKDVSDRTFTAIGNQVAIRPLAEIVHLCCTDSLPLGFEWANDVSYYMDGGYAGGACAIFADRLEFKYTTTMLWEMINQVDVSKWGKVMDARIDYPPRDWPNAALVKNEPL